jgi:hypothetical protein
MGGERRNWKFENGKKRFEDLGARRDGFRTIQSVSGAIRVFVTKERMRSEGLGRLLLESQHFGGLIEVLFAAFIATNAEAAVDRGARGDGVGFGKRDSMPEKQILAKVKPMVLAGNHPKIPAIFPHSR